MTNLIELLTDVVIGEKTYGRGSVLEIDSEELRKELLDTGKAKAAAVTATQGQAVAQAQVPIVEHYGTTTRVIIQQAEKGAADVQKLPGADDRLDPAFAAGLRGLLDPPAVATDPDHP